jgi:hypothetical protein
MKEIRGKKYYVSLGYVSKMRSKEVIKAEDIQSIFIPDKDCVMYFDDSVEGKPIALPLVRVNDIQRKGKVFKFSYILDPLNIEFNEAEFNILNVIGLFATYNKDGKQVIQHVGFFKTDSNHRFDKEKAIQPLPIVIETDAAKILGE